MLSNATRNTLTNYYHHLRCVPRQQDVYPDHFRQPEPDSWNPNQRALPIYTQTKSTAPKSNKNPDNPLQWIRSPEDLVSRLYARCTNGAKGRTDSEGAGQISAASSSCPNPQEREAIDRLVQIHGSFIVDQLKSCPDYPRNSLELLQSTLCDRPPGTSRNPVWPPGAHHTINTKTMQIRDRGQIHPNLWSTNRLEGQTREHETAGSTFLAPRNASYVPFASYYEQTNPTNRSTQFKLTQPRFEPDDTEEPPLRSRLQPTGDRVVDGLGLPFKTHAQRRQAKLVHKMISAFVWSTSMTITLVVQRLAQSQLLTSSHSFFIISYTTPIFPFQSGFKPCTRSHPPTCVKIIAPARSIISWAGTAPPHTARSATLSPSTPCRRSCPGCREPARPPSRNQGKSSDGTSASLTGPGSACLSNGTRDDPTPLSRQMRNMH